MSIELLRQKWNPPKDPDVSFEGKTILVTGASSGLGYEAALKFAQKGASKVILTARTVDKGQAAKDAIEAKVGKREIVEVWQLEMGSYESIKSIVEKAKGLERLDIVVLNAGVMTKDYRVSEYGWETTLQINVLSTTLLALMLLQKLRASKTPEWTPVLEIVSSGLYRRVEIPNSFANAPLEAYNKPENFKRQNQYNVSKFFVQCVVKHIAKMTQPDEASKPEVIVPSVCPGACKSGLGRELMGNVIVRTLANIFFALFTRTAEEGSRSFVSGTVQGGKANGMVWQNDNLQP
jgi:NAD(P)-dependent dehydrogenase (short-subunit alcohol dehydrogenase family)